MADLRRAVAPFHPLIMKRWFLKALGIALILLAIGLAVSRAPDRPASSLVARWAPPPSEFIEVKGQAVHVRDVGPRDDPSPIVLLHGTGASLHTWEGWVAGLKDRRRVVTLDLPGFGLTGPFAGQYAPEDYRADTSARFVIDVMDRLRITRAVLGGNSLGGELAWRVATLAPERVDRLILVAPAGTAFKPHSVPIGLLIARIPGLNRIGEHLLPRSLMTASVTNVYGDPSKVTPQLVDRYFELMLREGNRHALTLRVQQFSFGADADRIDRIAQPALLLWGGRDRLIPPDVAQEFKRRLRHSELVIFDDLGHVPQEEDPARSLVPVRRFLESPPAPAG